MATTAQHIAARGNPELLERLIATAEMNGVPNAAAWVQQYIGTLISTPLTTSGTDTIASVLDYAQGQYDSAVAALPPKPGANPSAVTDSYLDVAVKAVLTPETPPSP